MSCKGCNNVKCNAENKERKVVAPDVSWKDITAGGTITDAGNAELFNTGDWRSMKPIWIKDTAILVDKDGKRMDFNYDHCKGCGICAKVCPFKAIDFVEEI